MAMTTSDFRLALGLPKRSAAPSGRAGATRSHEAGTRVEASFQWDLSGV